MPPAKASVGFIGTFPPTQCGLATFTAALMGSMVCDGQRDVGVIDVLGSSDGPRPIVAPVVAQWRHGDARSLSRAISASNEFDAIILQHEYGVFGGPDGSEVVDFLRGVATPAITVLHTILSEPTTNQRRVLEAVVRASRRVVVMTEAARRRLVGRFDVETSKIVVIPHGAHPAAPAPPRQENRRPIVLTWGLIGPGKGIEWAIDSITEIRDVLPTPRYVVAGQTHPKVLASRGESYREGLVDRSRALGVDHIVEFDSTYRDLSELSRLVAEADVVLLPYESTEQVTSGVLIEAVAAGKPVVATRFPHAVELLATGAGLVVPHRDPQAMGRAVQSILTHPTSASSMRAEARRLSTGLLWSSVAARFDQVVTAVLPQTVGAVA